MPKQPSTTKGDKNPPEQPSPPEKIDVMSLYGIVKPAVRGVTLEDMEDAIGEAAAR